jgi:hypothetical protein
METNKKMLEANEKLNKKLEAIESKIGGAPTETKKDEPKKDDKPIDNWTG